MKLLNSLPLITYVVFTVLNLSGCFDEPNGESNKPDYDISLSVEEVSCLSASLRLTVLGDSAGFKEYSIIRNNAEICKDSMYGNDTLIIDTGLKVNSSYSYRAYILTGNTVVDSSNELDVSTLDSTEHHFAWSIDTLGGNPSSLHDVAIIGENDIWAVGDIRAAGGPYNAAHWNGEKWELTNLCRENGFFVGKGILIFSEDDIWITSNGTINHWNGKETQRLWSIGDYTKGGVANIWGTSSSNIYFVGDKGTIVHYDGSKFTKMNSGTDIDLRDIAGIGENVFVVGNGDGPESILLELKNGKWNTLLESDSYLGNIEHGDYGFISAVDVLGNTAYIVTEQGLLKYNYRYGILDIDTYLNYQMILDTYRSIIVQVSNDIMLFGGLGNMLHFNGLTWKKYSEFDLPGLVFKSGAFYGNEACMVGGAPWIGSIIVTGRRY
jgi:hypothetical protein